MKVTREIFYFKLSADSRSAATSTPTMPTETSYIAIIPEKEEAILRGSPAPRYAKQSRRVSSVRPPSIKQNVHVLTIFPSFVRTRPRPSGHAGQRAMDDATSVSLAFVVARSFTRPSLAFAVYFSRVAASGETLFCRAFTVDGVRRTTAASRGREQLFTVRGNLFRDACVRL